MKTKSDPFAANLKAYLVRDSFINSLFLERLQPRSCRTSKTPAFRSRSPQHRPAPRNVLHNGLIIATLKNTPFPFCKFCKNSKF